MSPNSATLEPLVSQAPGPEWLELFDPHTNRVVYANTVPRDPNGEWWELVDDESGVPYYYNSTTGATEWEPPEQATVVPFHALLTSSVGRRLSIAVTNRGSVAFTSDQAESIARKASRASLRSTDGRLSRTGSLARSASHHRRKLSSASAILASLAGAATTPPEPVAEVDEACISAQSNDLESIESFLRSCPPQTRAKTSSIIETKSKLESGTRASLSGEERDRRRLSAQRNSQSETALETLKEALAATNIDYYDERDEEYESTRPSATTDTIAADDCDDDDTPGASREHRDKFDESAPIGKIFIGSHHIDYNVPASANVEHFRISDNPLRADTANGRPRNFSEQPFHTTAGPERMSAHGYYSHAAANSVMMHSHRNRSMPSIRADSRLYGMRTFASTQFASQKRGFLRRKVPLDEMISYSSETLTRPLMNLPRELTRDAVRSFRVIQRYMGNVDEDISQKEKFSDVLWLANIGVQQQPMRDEIFCQLAKQVTGNPSPSATEKGWALFGVLLYAFRPSQLFFPHIDAFVDSAPVSSIALKRFLRLQLGRVKRTGSRTSELSVKELRLALTVPSRPLIFGGALGEIMADPELINRNTGLPRVLEQLTSLILSLGGEHTEGLFRVPGNSDAVFITRLQIEAGLPDFSDTRDPNVPASLLKEWLRDLADPLIPESMYEECISNPADKETVDRVLAQIPQTSLAVIKYLLSFFAHLLQPEIIEKTKMDSSNLALVFGPTLLRNPANDLKDIFTNSSGEQTFVQTMIDNFKP
ncbi:hypothetical protein GGI07_005527 [Coemansia sp. Benny D115]|nr:hypothetical protein GGI07_005527 [Coemansia sp. Benny D115]